MKPQIITPCRKCGGTFGPIETRFGSPTTGWEHMGECPPVFDVFDDCVHPYDTRDHADNPDNGIGYWQNVHPDDAAMILDSTPGDDTRSEWRWFRMPNGDLIFGCFPCDDMYFATEQRRDV